MNRLSTLVLLSLMAFAEGALAEPTIVTVRVKTNDAKFLGSSMGGALVTIQELKSGTVLAEGVTEGGTGDTRRIMKEPHTRGTPLADEKTAKFTAVVDIKEPTYVKIAAQGPAAWPESANRVSVTQWLFPGKHITAGDGLVLVLPGFVVQITSPGAAVDIKGLPRTVRIDATVKLMCGCPLTPGGIWNSEKIEIKALVKRDVNDFETVTMGYAGEASQFTGSLAITQPGTYEVLVYAFDPATGNTGLDRVAFKAE